MNSASFPASREWAEPRSRTDISLRGVLSGVGFLARRVAISIGAVSFALLVSVIGVLLFIVNAVMGADRG